MHFTRWIRSTSFDFELIFSEFGLCGVNIFEPQTQALEISQTLDVYATELFFNSKLPVDIKGTDFQKKVWKEICKIPIGKTLSYKNLSEKIGKPYAYRAVAKACSQNSLAWIIPCHRVIASNGNLSGYRWGAKLKKALLEIEQL